MRTLRPAIWAVVTVQVTAAWPAESPLWEGAFLVTDAAAARLAKTHAAWDAAISVIDQARNKQAQAPGLQGPAKKALAAVDRGSAASSLTGAIRW